MNLDPIILTFGDGKQSELLQNVIEFTESQKNEIQALAIQKTQEEWMGMQSGEKFNLSDIQKAQVLKYKDEFFEGLTAEEVMREQLIEFMGHALERIDERFEKKDFSSVVLEEPETVLKLVQVLMDAQEVGDTFEWKGYPTITFAFRGLDFSIVFEKIIIIATFDDEESLVITTFTKKFHGHLKNKVSTKKKTLA